MSHYKYAPKNLLGKNGAEFSSVSRLGSDDHNHSDESEMKDKKKWLRSHIVRLHGFSGIPEITRRCQGHNVVRNKLILRV